MGRAGRLAGTTRWAGAVLVLATSLGCQPADETADQRPARLAHSQGATAVPGAARTSSATATGWRRLPDVPLSRRDHPTVQRVGRSVLVLGGTRPMHCPQGGFCPYPGVARGGAVLDLRTRTWRRITPPPPSVEGVAPLSGAPGGLLVVRSDRIPERLFAYDLRSDIWTRMPPPPRPMMGGDGSLVVTRHLVFEVPEQDTSSQPIQRLDLRSRRWTVLPRSTLRPRLALRRLFVTSTGLVVMGGTYDAVTQGSTRARAEILGPDGWRRLRSPGYRATGWEWHWTGHRLVAPVVTGQPRRGLTLDPATGRWGSFRHPAYDGGRRWSIGSATSGDLVFLDGSVYDDSDGSWSRVDLPTRVARRGGAAVWVGRRLLVVDRHCHTWLSSPF